MATMDVLHLSIGVWWDQVWTASEGTMQPVEEEEVASFFDQLWLAPRPRAARVSHILPNLFWIRRDLWESKNFGSSDCYPAKESDVLKPDPKQGTFIGDFFARGARRSFLKVVQEGMAGRAN
jgi:hypothetical protein